VRELRQHLRLQLSRTRGCRDLRVVAQALLPVRIDPAKTDVDRYMSPGEGPANR
jgi:hypothetical protein